jgi:SAM-dependent methyltransferase
LLGLILRADVPPYFDLLIDGFKAGRTGRHVHLGYWDAPPPLSSPCAAAEFETAQARLADVVIGLADLRDGQSVLDVGCGFGGTLAAIGERWTNMRLTGVNIDPRQLDICRTVTARAGNSLSFELADACAMPFDAASLDRVICLEAMFHFSSRADFLREAARLLRPGGRLALTDILLKRPGASEAEVAALEQTMRREYGRGRRSGSIGRRSTPWRARPDCNRSASSMPPRKRCRVTGSPRRARTARRAV